MLQITLANRLVPVKVLIAFLPLVFILRIIFCSSLPFFVFIVSVLDENLIHMIILYSVHKELEVYAYSRKVPELCCQRVILGIIFFEYGVKKYHVRRVSFSPILQTLCVHLSLFLSASAALANVHSHYSFCANFRMKLQFFGWILIANVFCKMWPQYLVASRYETNCVCMWNKKKYFYIPATMSYTLRNCNYEHGSRAVSNK